MRLVLLVLTLLISTKAFSETWRVSCSWDHTGGSFSLMQYKDSGEKYYGLFFLKVEASAFVDVNSEVNKKYRAEIFEALEPLGLLNHLSKKDLTFRKWQMSRLFDTVFVNSSIEQIFFANGYKIKGYSHHVFSSSKEEHIYFFEKDK